MGVVAVLLIILVLGGIGGYIIFHGWQNMARAEAARAWPFVEGRIVTSRVEVTKGSKGTTFYNPAFTYEYRVGDRVHRGERLAFGTPTGGERDEAEAIVARTPPGTATKVHYDPAFPDASVLDPTPQTGEYLAFFAAGAAFILVPLGIVVCGLVS